MYPIVVDPMQIKNFPNMIKILPNPLTAENLKGFLSKTIIASLAAKQKFFPCKAIL